MSDMTTGPMEQERDNENERVSPDKDRSGKQDQQGQKGGQDRDLQDKRTGGKDAPKPKGDEENEEGVVEDDKANKH